ncbi:hypothetical protein [Streptomyces sp. NBC_00648]|uniref:hypothetical protein n=1 Tax=Streptomyces sp. NBC_00648 TaxID=2975797 RepID=UPI002F91928D
MAAHPLAFLRASTGVSHPSYARLVAETHAKLGYGHMAARREKIWRWESGRTVPELTAQLAIAHLHQVPEADVRRLGWPHWLHLAAGDAVLLTRPWTPRGAIDALRDGSRLAERRDLSYLAVTGPFVDTLTRQWTSAAAVRADGRKPGEPHPAEPHPGEPDTVYRARVRVEVLETMASTLPAAVLHPAARNDLSLLTSLVSAAGHDSAATAPLLLLAARTANLCAGQCIALGESATAERYYLLASRAAAAADHPELSAACLAGVAYSHLLEGAPGEVIPLVEAALTAPHRPGHRLAVLLHLLAARAHALAGEAAPCAHALERAGTALAAHTAVRLGEPCSLARDLGEDCAAVVAGTTAFHLGRPRQALGHFAPLLDTSRFFGLRPFAVHELLHVVDTQLALGEVEAAAHTAGRAVAHCDGPPAKVVRQYQKRFAAHGTVPAVRDLLASLTPHLVG